MGIVARTSSWMRVSTVSRKSLADGAIAKKAGYSRVKVVPPVKTPKSWTTSSTSRPVASAARSIRPSSRSSG